VREVQGIPRYPLELAPGATLHLPWDDAWMPGGPLVGEVATLGVRPEELRVVPLAGDVHLRVLAGWVVRFPVREDGSFEIPGFPARITRLDFAAVGPGGRLVPLGFAAPGELATIRSARVRLELTGVAPDVEVRADVPLHLGGAETIERIRLRRRGPGPLELGPLPLATDALVLAWAKETREGPLALEAGRAVTLRIDLAR